MLTLTSARSFIETFATYDVNAGETNSPTWHPAYDRLTGREDGLDEALDARAQPPYSDPEPIDQPWDSDNLRDGADDGQPDRCLGGVRRV